MIDELFRIGSFAISPFGVLLVLAFFAAYWELQKGLKHLGIGDEEDASAILFAGGFAGILGGKVYYAILYGDWRLIFDRAGIVWYGGFLAGTLAVLWVVRRRRLPIARTTDAAGPALALGYGIGRIGCFLVGDDYGRPTDLPWGVSFEVGLPPNTAGNLRDHFGVDVPYAVPDDAFVPVHPTQLYETGLALGIWWLARRLLRRDVPAGVPVLATVSLLAIERFGIEFLRAKDDRFLGELTVAQGISLAVLAVASFLLWVRLRKPRPPELKT